MTTPMVPVTINGVLERPGGDSAEPGEPWYFIMLTETGDVFYAQAVLASGTVVDARPSDALNLAVISDAPVYVATGLLSAGREYSSDGPPG